MSFGFKLTFSLTKKTIEHYWVIHPTENELKKFLSELNLPLYEKELFNVIVLMRSNHLTTYTARDKSFKIDYVL